MYRTTLITGLCALLLTLSACVTSSTYAWLNSLREQLWPEIEVELAEANLQPGAPLYLRIFKEEAILEAWMQNHITGRYDLYKTYPICKYSGLLGPKQREGDHQAPEGFYDVSEDWLWPESQYHLAMNIGYPNQYDREHGRTGSFIMIHGGCQSEGCFAMTNPGIEEIYLLAEQSLLNGQDAIPIHIFPFRMTDANMKRYAKVHWIPFWENLKRGHDLFEETYIPPAVAVRNGRYIFPPQVFSIAASEQAPVP